MKMSGRKRQNAGRQLVSSGDAGWRPAQFSYGKLVENPCSEKLSNGQESFLIIIVSHGNRNAGKGIGDREMMAV
jgi:hypothetical protein